MIGIMSMLLSMVILRSWVLSSVCVTLFDVICFSFSPIHKERNTNYNETTSSEDTKLIAVGVSFVQRDRSSITGRGEGYKMGKTF